MGKGFVEREEGKGEKNGMERFTFEKRYGKQNWNE